MKKKCITRGRSMDGLKKLLLIMKMTVFFLFVSVLSISANTYSQSTKLNLNLENANIIQVFDEIEKQSEFGFFFKSDDLNLEEKFNLSMENVLIENILSKVLDKKTLKYQIVDKNIVIFMNDVAQKTVTGKIIDEDGFGIPGVNIVIKGTTDGTITDLDGNYSLEVPDENTILVFSYVGYATQEIMVETRTILDVVMVEETIGMDEVVVIGYGTQKRKHIAGSVHRIKMENSPMASIPNINPLQALQGASTGVNIGAVSSAGGDPSLLIRGRNSISASNNPLIVLDGVIFNGSLNEISMGDIASFDILKDASAASIYGSRSANGVILISTKRGKSEKPVISINTYYGVQSWTRIPEMRMGEDFLQWRRDNRIIRNRDYEEIDDLLGTLEMIAYDTGHQMNWFDEISQYAPVQNYQASISGSANNVNYYVSASLMDQKGVIDNDNYQNYGLTAKIDNKINDWLSYGVNLYYSSRDYSGTSPSLYMATYYTPYSYKWVDGYDNVLQRYPTTSFLYNPYWGQPQLGEPGYYDDDLNKMWSVRSTGFVKMDVPFIKGLSYRLNFTARKGVNQRGFFHHEMGEVNTRIADQIEDPSRFLNKTYGWKETGNSDSWVIDNLLSYKKELEHHSFDILVGYTRDYYVNETLRFAGGDFSSLGTSVLGYNGLNLGSAELRSGITSFSEAANIGYIGRLNYSFKDRYHLTFNFRRDGYSAFGEGHKFGVFPGAAIAWTISEEDFMKNMTSKIDYLKVRASYGKNGNQGISPYATMAGVATGLTVFGDESFTYSYPSSLANKALSWETTTAFNIGINYSLFEGRISGDIDMYKSETTDQLLSRNLPIMTGYESVRTNIAQVDNIGAEIFLRTVNIKTGSGFTWETGMRFWMNRNELVSLTGLDADGDGIEDDDIGSLWFIGKSLGAIYDFTIEGVVQNEDTEYTETYGIGPGELKIKDISGPDDVPDGEITADDRSIIGYTVPNFNMNISNTLSYRNFQLYFDINIIAGGGKDNFYMASNQKGLRPSAMVPDVGNWLNLPYWMPDNQNDTYPSPSYSNPFEYGFWQVRSFTRLQNLTLSYTFPQKVEEALNVRDLRVFISGKNLITLTDWIGLDPENAGQIGGSSPVIRTFSLGANLSF